MTSGNSFYVYILVDPLSLTPFYVGKGKGNRWRHHTWRIKGRTNDRVRTIEQAGRRVIVEIPIFEVDEDFALLAERKLIAFWGRVDFDHGGSLLNRNTGGNGGKGVSWSAERKHEHAVRFSGNGNPMHGRSHSTEARQAISEARKQRGGTPHSAEHKEALRRHNKGGVVTSKPVNQYDIAGELVNRWPSASSAAKSLGFRKGNLCDVASRNPQRKCGGYYWRYAPSPDKIDV